MSETTTGISTSGAFKGLKTPRQLLQYNLMRGVTDFSNLEQWDLYESGYPFLVCVKAPDFLMDLAEKDPNGIGVIINNYIHVLENDFRGIDNIDNIQADAAEITNGIRSIQVINKVNKPSNSNFTMRYYERSGSLLTKAHELYLTGIKDPDTQVKHYHGLIDDYIYGNASNGGSRLSGSDPGPHRECFTFMYFLTDNTMTKIERAFLICAAQPTTAPYSDLYVGDKGAIEFKEVSLSFNGFFINNDMVYIKAQKMLMAMRNPNNLSGSRIIVDSNNFAYDAISNVTVGDESISSDGTNSRWTNNTWWNENGQYTGDVSKIGNNGSQPHGETSQGAYYDSLRGTMINNSGEHFIPVGEKNDIKNQIASGAIGNDISNGKYHSPV